MVTDDRSWILGELEQAGRLYTARYLNPRLRRFPAWSSDPWDGLRFFVDGYAFERQGRPAEYSAVAVDLCEQLEAEARRPDGDLASLAWERFVAALGRLRPNAANSPLAPGNADVSNEPRPGASLSVFQLQETALDLPRTMLGYVEAGDTSVAHETLQCIRGVGPKIASFFLRDLALIRGETNVRDRTLLQPVDIWVKRCATVLSPGLQVEDTGVGWGELIVGVCVECGVSPELVNAGMWYFGAQVCQSQFALGRNLLSRELLTDALNDHVNVLKDAVASYLG